MRSISLRFLLLISVVYLVTTKNLTNDASADNGLSLKNARRMQNSEPETQKIDQNITFHWKNSYYCLFISSIVLIGSLVFLCYQIKLMRFFFRTYHYLVLLTKCDNSCKLAGCKVLFWHFFILVFDIYGSTNYWCLCRF